MFMVSRGLAALLLFVGGCDAPSEGTGKRPAEANPAAKARDTFLGCWRGLATDTSTGSFKGAVAIYRRGNGRTAALFAKKCPPENALTLGASGWILVETIVDSGNSQMLAKQGYLIDKRFVERELGTTSEFPDDMFAIEGRLRGSLEQEGAISVVSRLEVSRKQRIPTEVYGQFMAYVEDRKDLIDFYLDHRFFDERGYKVME